MTRLRKYTGLAPSNVSSDASYSVVGPESAPEIRLKFRISNRERALLTTDGHPDLVDMVNAVKKAISAGTPGGRFYINEFRDVLVPDGQGGAYWAGKYRYSLEFDFDGTIIGPEAPDGLEPGDTWTGPHVGVRYTLAAGARDIRYKIKEGRIERTEMLSDSVGPEAAAELAARLGRVRGSSGGRFYINEAAHFFSPDPEGGADFIYLGCLTEDDQWFFPPEEFEDD